MGLKDLYRLDYLADKYCTSENAIQEVLDSMTPFDDESEVLDWHFMPGFNPSTATLDEGWRGGCEWFSLIDYVVFEKSIKNITPHRRTALEDMMIEKDRQNKEAYYQNILAGGCGVMAENGGELDMSEFVTTYK